MDTILFGEGINPEDLRLWTNGNGYLFIQYSETDFIQIQASAVGGFGTASRVGEYLEQIVFADETTWDLTQGLYLHNNDTARTLFGSNYGDTIIAGAGNDTVVAYGGDDLIVAGTGRMCGVSGNERRRGPPTGATSRAHEPQGWSRSPMEYRLVTSDIDVSRAPRPIQLVSIDILSRPAFRAPM
jgi:hypothetical protein